MVDGNYGPRCEVCYKELPSNFAGFDICPMCLYLSREKASAFHARIPSYRTPLQALQEGSTSADDNC